MFAGTALSVHLFVYVGLSLFTSLYTGLTCMWLYAYSTRITLHLFDMPAVTKSCNRKWRTKVSHGLAPLKGVKPVHDKGGFRIDESAVLPEMRPPIPLTKITDV